MIAPSELDGDLAHALDVFGEQVTLLAPEGAKGLEFDVFVVIERATIAGTRSGLWCSSAWPRRRGFPSKWGWSTAEASTFCPCLDRQKHRHRPRPGR